MSSTRRTRCRRWLVERLQELGWEHVPGAELPREKHRCLVSRSGCIEAIETLNPDLVGEPERVDEVLPLVRSAVLSAGTEALVDANERMTTLLRGAQTVKYVGTDEHVPLRLIDFETSRTTARRVR